MLHKFLVGLVVVGVMLAGCARAEPEPEDPNGNAYPMPQPTTPPQADDPVTAPPYPEPGDGYEGPFEPQPGDEDLQRGEALMDTFTLLTMESYPLQFALVMRGNLPTPCHELRAIVAEPDEQNRIMIETYTVFDPDEPCILVLEPFEVNIQLGSFPEGEYSVYVDGQLVAEFESY